MHTNLGSLATAMAASDILRLHQLPLGFDIRADDLPAENYRRLADLKAAAYHKLYVGFTDHHGVDQGTVFVIGACSERPMLLRKRQV